MVLGFNIQYTPIFNLVSRLARRKRYQKATILGASEQHPVGFETLDAAFQWPKTFFQRVATRFGTSWLCKRLKAWRWTFASAFSGIGAPESVPVLVVMCCNMSQC